MIDDVDPEGGDPPCWAHLFESEWTDGAEPAMMAPGPDVDDAGIVDLVAIARMAATKGAAWTRRSEDLDVNLLVFAAGEGVAEHVNAEVDVLLVGILGSGVVTVDGACHVLRAGHVLVIPKGARQSTRSADAPFAYFTGHRRRGGLWPSR